MSSVHKRISSEEQVSTCNEQVPSHKLSQMTAMIESAVPDDLLRLSVGIENVDDLISDLQQALS